MDWESWANVAHYYVIERRLQPWGLALRQTWRASREHLAKILARLRAVARRHPEEEDMEIVTVEAPPVPLPVVGRAILSRLDGEARQALVAAITEEIRESIKAEAVATAKLELDTAYQERRETMLDEAARTRQALERECDNRIEVEVEAQLVEARQEWEDRPQTLREQRRAWRTRAEAEESPLP